MLGKKNLLVLLVLGLAMFMVAAQNPTQTPQEPDEMTPEEDVVVERNNGTEGLAGPTGPRRAPPNRPSLSIPRCRVQTSRTRVNRVVRYNRRTYRCYGYLNIRSCAGGCHSTYYTNPQTLAPVRRCPCCQPSRQAVQTFRNVVFVCPRGVPVNRRRFTYTVPVAASCSCQGC